MNNQKNILALNNVIIPGSTIAAHSIHGKNVLQDGTSILWNGLNLSLGEGILVNNTILSSVKDVYEKTYVFHDENGISGIVITAIPEVMEDFEGNKWYIGKYPIGSLKYDKRADNLPIDKYFRKIGKIPPEFIVGIVINDGKLNNSPEVLSLNAKYFGNMSDDNKKMYFESIKSELIKAGLLKTNDMPRSIEVDKLLGLSTYYADSLMAYQENNIGITR